MSQKANYADITNSIRKLLSHCIGHSRGSVSTKILALCDALGNLLKFALMPGQRHDSKGVEEMIRNRLRRCWRTRRLMFNG